MVVLLNPSRPIDRVKAPNSSLARVGKSLAFRSYLFSWYERCIQELEPPSAEVFLVFPVLAIAGACEKHVATSRQADH